MFSTLILVFLAALLFIIFWVIEQKWRFRSLKYFPGPVPHPILGSVLEFGKNPVDKLKNINRLLDTYGPTISSWIGPNRCFILTTDPDFCEFILSSPKHLTKSISYNLLKPWLSNGLLVSTGSYWQKRRKAITPAFHFKILEQFLPTFLYNADILADRLSKEMGKNVCDIYPYICAYTLDNICETAMGTAVNAQKYSDNEYPKAIKGVCNILTNRIFSAWKMFHSIYQFSNEFKLQQHFLNTIHTFTNNVIEKRKQNFNNDIDINENIDEYGRKKKIAFLDLLLQAKIDGKPLTNNDIREEVDTFMFEGHDTTASAICFAIFELARNPDIQERLMREYGELFGDDYNRQLTQTDLSNMKYTELIIKETLRLYPSVPLFGRRLTEDAYYKDIMLPKGLQIVISPFHMQRRPEYFKNPEQFYPERFLPESDDVKHPFAYIPFSAGPRNCIGQKFAMNEIKLTLYKIFSKFEVLPAEKEHDFILSSELILKSANGMSVRLKKRT